MKAPFVFAIWIFVSVSLLSPAFAQRVKRIHQDLTFVNFESPHVHPLDLSPSGERLAACNTANATIEIFAVTEAGLDPLASIPVGLEPVSVRFRNDSEVWSVNHLSDTISVIDVESLEAVSLVRTGDEPADVVFAGDPQRAYVTCSQINTVQVFDPESLSKPEHSIVIEGEDPRALAVSPDGRMVYAAVFESGNGTTILGGGTTKSNLRSYPPNAVDSKKGPYGGKNPVPNDGVQYTPARSLFGPARGAPEVGMIVKKMEDGRWMDDNSGDWTALVTGELAHLSGRAPGWDLADHDVAVIDTKHRSVAYVDGLMNLCMGLAVHPQTGSVSVVGTEATNHIRFEPNLNGTFVRVRQATFDYLGSGGASMRSETDLNPHLTYANSTIPQGQRDLSLGDPRAMVWLPDGSQAFIAGMGSNNVVVTDKEGRRDPEVAAIEVGEGPTGLAIDNALGHLYVLNRFSASISVIDTEDNGLVSEVDFHDPTPERVRAGRRHFYDTHKSSGLGQAACASCHADGRFDRLAWDLGDPSADVDALQGRVVLSGVAMVFPDKTEYHPMKGPMVTATLQGIMGNEPFHWRGDKDGLEDFNPTYEKLLGDDRQLTDDEMLEFKQYLATLHFAPNPYRGTDNALKEKVPLTGQFTTKRFGEPGQPLVEGNAVKGEALFQRVRLTEANRACGNCHFGTLGMSYPVSTRNSTSSTEALRFLSDHVGSDDGPFKVVHLRNLHEKIGFNATSPQSLSGFGFMHDGGVDTLARFVSQSGFAVRSDEEVADLTAFLISFAGGTGTLDKTQRQNFFNQDPYDVHAGVGHQIQLDPVSELSYFGVRRLIGIVEDSHGYLDLTVHGTKDGQKKAYLLGSSEQFLTDRGQRTIEMKSLLDRVRSDERLLFTLVPGGSGRRLSIDRDEDGLRQHDEERDLEPELDGIQNPFDSNVADSTGDYGSTLPDGIPDGENDFDGDGVSNADEIARGLNPIGGLYSIGDVGAGFRMSIQETSDPREWVLRWNVVADMSVRYQVEYSRNLKKWSQHQNPFAAREGQKSLETVFRSLFPNQPLYFRVRQVEGE